MAEVKKKANSKQLKADSEDKKKSKIEESEAKLSTADSTPSTATSKPVAKSGKRSEKSIKAATEKEAKEERKVVKAEAEAAETSHPKVQNKSRSVLERKGKKFRDASALIEKGKVYNLKEAVELAVKTSPVKFDATLEIHVRLGVDPRQADQNLRDTLVLPHGSGKTVRVAVFADTDDINAAKKAGADVAASDEFLQQLEKGVVNFDILIATPAMMPKLGKYARLLGPKGLMPNPKSGTVTTDVAKAVTESKAGRLEYRVDSTGIVHAGVGKLSFGADKLYANVQVLMKSLKNNKPSTLKGTYIKSIFVTTSMGPSITVDISGM